MRRVDVVYVLIKDEANEKILTVKNVRKTGFDYTLPGGAVETGENLAQAAIREVKEETGLDVEIGELLSLNEAFYSESGNHVLFFTFAGKRTGGELTISRPDEISEILWMDYSFGDKQIKNFGDGLKTFFSKQSAPYYFRGTL